MRYRSLTEALYTLSSPPAVSFKKEHQHQPKPETKTLRCGLVGGSILLILQAPCRELAIGTGAGVLALGFRAGRVT